MRHTLYIVRTRGKAIIGMALRAIKIVKTLMFIIVVPEDCTEGSVQLVDGIEQGGRVEVCVNGVWGSVCGEGWDKTDAHVVCKQMGFPDLGK